MIKIGITGGMGAGKSLVCKVFKVFGIPVFDADTVAKKIISNDGSIKDKLISHFGPGVYFNDGTLNKAQLAAVIFNDNKQLKYINSLVHPLVFKAFDKWAEQFKNTDYVLHETAILFESGADVHVDKTIVVTAPIDLRIKRILKRDGISRSEIESRLENQWEQSRIVELADMEIVNDGKKLLIPQIWDLHNRIIKQFK